eukprot:4116024-Pyramimonas_sp.AAC.1
MNYLLPTMPDCAGFCKSHNTVRARALLPRHSYGCAALQTCVGAYRDVADGSCARSNPLSCDDPDGLTEDHICQCALPQHAPGFSTSSTTRGEKSAASVVTGNPASAVATTLAAVLVGVLLLLQY